ncbi:MAG: autotransporter domain-containing protein [Chlorobaculum sp.]|nr:autotransporter domain-containing protein [Chlorobaculum sp.]
MKRLLLSMLLLFCMTGVVHAADYALSPDGSAVVRLVPQGTVAASTFNTALLTNGYTANTGTGGTLTITSYNAGFKSGTGGGEIKALYDRGAALGTGQGLEWVQVINTNNPLGGATSPYLDNKIPGKQDKPFYSYTQENKDPNLPANQLNFYDYSRRDPANLVTINPITWNASLYPVITDGTKTITILNGISWGWTMKKAMVGSTSGVFENPAPGSAVVSGSGTSHFTWGSGEPSSLTFAGTTFDTMPNTRFKLGTLSFHNGVIDSNSGADSVHLKVSLSFDNVPEKNFNYDSLFTLINTPNTGSAEDNADYVTLGGYSYTFHIYESSTASADLYFKISTNYTGTPSGVESGAAMPSFDPFDLNPDYLLTFLGFYNPTSGGFVNTVCGDVLGSQVGDDKCIENGTLTVDADNQTITGTLGVGSAGATVDTNGHNATISGVISGSGGLTKIGVGQLTLTGFNAYTGGTNLNEGGLSINGYSASGVAVGSTGTLHGTGTIHGNVVVSGELAPGNSPGTLNVAGTVTMLNNSLMVTDIDGLGTGNGAGNYDRLLISGSGNQFIIGGNVNLETQLRGITAPANNTFVPSLGETFRIVSASGGVDGRFASVLQPPSGLTEGTRLHPFYNVFDSNSIDLVTVPVQWKGYLANNGGNENTQSAGQVLDQLIASDTAGTATAAQQELLYCVARTNDAMLPGLATELSGEMHASLAAEVPYVLFGVQSAISDYIGYSQLGGTCNSLGSGIWFSAGRSWEQWHGDSVASTFDADRYQYVLGYDFLTDKKVRLGAGYSYSTVNLNHSAYDSNGSIYAHSGFIYCQYRPNGVIFEGLASIAPTTWRSSRPDPLGLYPALTTHTTGTSGMIGVTVKVPLDNNTLLLEPYASGTWIHNDRGSVTEGNAQSALALPGYSMNGARIMGGLTVGSKRCDPLLVPTTFSTNICVGYDTSRLANPEVDASMADVPFTIQSPEVSNAFVQTKASATVRLSPSGYCYASYAGLFRSGAESQGVELGVKFAF